MEFFPDFKIDGKDPSYSQNYLCNHILESPFEMQYGTIQIKTNLCCFPKLLFQGHDVVDKRLAIGQKDQLPLYPRILLPPRVFTFEGSYHQSDKVDQKCN